MQPKEEGSGLRIYSLGIVLTDKSDDGDFIEVNPIEQLPQTLGPIKDTKYEFNVQGTDHRGAAVSSSVTGIAYCVARWLPLGNSNRTTSPNVYKNETVLLWKFGSSEEVFWTELFREPKFRKLENIIFIASNAKEVKEISDLDTSYYFQVSTRDRLIKLHTSMNQGEPLEFDLTINTDEGTLTIQDTNENKLFWDGVNGDLKLDMINSVEVNTKQIRFNGSEYVHTTAPDITEKGDDIVNNASTSITYTSGGTWDATSGGVIALHVPTVITGNVTIAGSVVATGDGVFGPISVISHTHLYRPGDGGPTPSSTPV